MSGYPTSPGTPLSASALGVRPAPALVQRLLVGAFGWMFAGLLLSAGVAYLVGSSLDLMRFVVQWSLALVIGQLALAMGIQFLIGRMSATLALLLFFVFCATMGLTIGAIVAAYVAVGATAAVAAAFVSASGMFAAAAAYGAVTKRSLAGLGGILFMALIGLIIASVINLFLGSSQLDWIISIAGVVIFTALTAYDTQRIARGDYAAWTGSMEKASIIAALHLYINFVNLFLFLLRLFGGNRN